MPIEHPWDLRNIHAIFVALLAVIIDPAFLEPIRIAFFNMRAPPRVPQPRQNAAQRNSEDYVTIVRVLALEPQIRRHTVVLPRNPNAIERDGDATDEEDEPERSPQEVAAENLARDIHQQQEEKERRIQDSIANGSSNGGASRGNAHGAVRATPYGRRPGASSSNARRGPAGPNGNSNGPNAGAGPSNHHNALGAGPGPNNYSSNNYPSNQQNAVAGPSNNSNSQNAVAGPSNHPNALRDTRPGNDANRENAVAGPSNHPNALRLDSTSQNAEAGPSNYRNALRADAGPSNPPATRREEVPDFDILDLSSLWLNDNSPAVGKGKGKQRADNGSRSAPHQLPASSSQTYPIVPQALLESFDPRDLFEEESSSNQEAGVSSGRSGFVPTPASAQAPSSQTTSQTPSQPSLLSRLSAQAEAPTQARPSPVLTNSVFEAARPQHTFQQQQPFQPSFQPPPFQPAAAWNTEQPTSSWVPINNDAQPTAFQPGAPNSTQAERVQTQPSAQQLPAYLYDEDVDMDQDVDTNTATPWVQMNQHAQQPVHQPVMQSFGQAGTWVQTQPRAQQQQHAQQPVHQPVMQSFGQAGTWVQTQPRAQQEQQPQFHDGNAQSAWASTSNAEQSGGNLAYARAPTEGANFGGVHPSWVQTYNRAQLLQEQVHYDPTGFHRAEPPSFQQQAPATFYSQQACTPHNQPSVDHAAEQFERATNVWLGWISSSVSNQETSFASSPASTSHTAPPPPTQSQPEEPAMTPEEAESERRFWDMVRRAEDEATERRRNPFNYAAAVARGPSATAYLNRRVPEVSVHSPRPIRSLPRRADPRQRQVADGPLGSEANLQYRLEQERRLEERARRRQLRAERAQPPAETPCKRRKRRRDDATPPATSDTPTADEEPTPPKRARSEPPKVDAEVQVETEVEVVAEVEVDTRTRLISGGSNGVVSWNTYTRLATRREKKERKASRFCPSLSSITGFFSSRLAFLKS